MIAGQEQPDQGEILIGKTVRLSLVDQSREALNNDKTVFEDISEGTDLISVGRFEMNARAYLGRFNFKGSDQQKKSRQSLRRRTGTSSSGKNIDERRQCPVIG